MSTPTKPTKRERRETRREDERRRRAEAARRARTTRLLTFGAIALLVVAGIALAAGPLASLFRATGAQAQGTQYPNQGQEHINPGATHVAYNSNPPTSGPHYPDPAPWGIKDQPLPDEQLVHNLEHGGIVIGYNCPDGCPEIVAQLRDLASGYRSKVILAPRPNADVKCRITLTAWTWLDCLDGFDAERINAFIRAHKDRGPEIVPD
ncbi:MAG TPA: DUF3105 domain-containing protein [Chloroflexota bacterium]|jgi:hypothetical protein